MIREGARRAWLVVALCLVTLPRVSGGEPRLRGPSPDVAALALESVRCAAARGLVPRPELVTIIDYSLPSTEPRLWVIVASTGEVRHRELVAHGKGSGENFAERFSNRSGSRESSLGLFVTADTYRGKHGYALRLDGLEPGFNDRARERAIVMHGASYATSSFVARHGRLGRSWGCPAVRPEVAKAIFDEIRGGAPLFIYYPERRWLDGSMFLNGCGDDSARLSDAAAPALDGRGAAGGTP
jgi:hypothetical protein